MTDGENEVKKTERAPQASRAKKGFEWFWRGAALAETRRAWPEPSERALQLALRARTSADVGRSVLTPAQPLEEASVQAIANELFRESAYWAVCSSSEYFGEAVPGVYDESIWDKLDQPLLARAVKSPERIAPLRDNLRAGSFVTFAERPLSEQLSSGAELQQVAELLCQRLDARAHALQKLYLQRAWRLCLILLAAMAVFFGVHLWLGSRDMAVGKPWQASSKLAGFGCVSPAQHCPEGAGVFFHTDQERNPWVEFDLGAVQDVSGLKVDNRTDFPERAVPLIIEVSTNHRRWKTVARRDEVFSKWHASFDTVKARWVRLRAQKKTWLHLSRVRIFP